MYQYLYVGGCIIVYFAYLDFSFVNSFQDGVDDGRGGLAIRNLCDSECLVVQLVDLGAYFYRSAAFSVIVFGYVDGTACLEVGI